MTTAFDHLIERFISATWLAVLWSLFIYSGFDSLKTPPVAMGCSVVAFVIAFLFGFFRDYQTLCRTVNDHSHFALRLVSSIWFGSLTLIICIAIASLFNNEQPQPSALFISIIFAIAFIVFLLTWKFLYRFLLFPSVHYLKSHPSMNQRIVSATWFGLTAYVMMANNLNHKQETIWIFALLLAAYLGFTEGYRILLLPTSIRGAIKSILIGFIWSSYALWMVFFNLIINFFLINAMDTTESYLTTLTDVIEKSGIMISIFFPIAGLFVCGITMISSLIYFFISRLYLEDESSKSKR